MKIKTRLKLNIWFSLGVVTLMLISLGWSFWEAERADQNVLLIHEIEKTAFQRIILRDDWLLNQGERAKIQWHAKTETLRKLLESASQKITGKEAKYLLRDAKKDFEATFSLFPILLEKYKKGRITIKKKFDFTEAESRLIGQVFLKAYSLNDNISRLHELCRKEAMAARNRGIILIIVFIIGGITAMVINSVSLNVIMTKRVATLADGIKFIGDGNLDYQITAEGDDEITDLIRGINEMAAKLKQAYTSMENLHREVTEKERAKERIHRQGELLLAINSIFLESLTTINKEAIAQVCLKVVQELTGSKFGFIGEITPENLFTTIALSNPGWEACRIPETQANAMIKNMVIRGIWGQVLLKEQSLFVNDPVSYPDRVGIPEGHPPLTSFLGVPLKSQGKVIGMIAVANRDSGYTENHQQDLEALSVAFSEAIQRQQTEEKIRLLNAELEQRVIARTAELTTKTAELERINKVFVDRELRMRELKTRIAELEKKT